MKQTRMYGLFEKQDGRWVRLHPELAFKKDTAVRVFQNALLAPHMSSDPSIKGVRELHPIRPTAEPLEKNGE